MRVMEWEIEKKQEEWVVFDLWPFFSSLLPTFIPLGLRLLISHCHIVTHVLIMLCFHHLTVLLQFECLTKIPPDFQLDENKWKIS